MPEMPDDVLLGYLLDALDRDARRTVEDQLRAHPDAGARMATLRRMLAPLEADVEAPEPPPGLAESTLARIAEHAPLRRLPTAPPPSPRQAGAPARRNLRRADLVVAGLMTVLAAGLCLTWLARQWRDYQVLACQNNLHRLWAALQVYADGRPEDGGAFPRVTPLPPRNFAGVFMPVLADAGALGADATAVCPARGGPPPAPCTLAQLDDLARRRPDEYWTKASALGGDYAYTLGYRRGRDLFGLSRDSGDLLPILADRPRDAGLGNSPNHDGSGQNVLYIGGHVRWCDVPTVGVDRDDIYRNLKYQVFAGEHELDTVLGPSNASPIPNP
jgi:hypothetical protein